MSVIGVTSLPHSSVTPSRHSSGKRLFEVADMVVDTGIPPADAAIRIDGLDSPVGRLLYQHHHRHRSCNRCLHGGNPCPARHQAAS